MLSSETKTYNSWIFQRLRKVHDVWSTLNRLEFGIKTCAPSCLFIHTWSVWSGWLSLAQRFTDNHSWNLPLIFLAITTIEILRCSSTHSVHYCDIILEYRHMPSTVQTFGACQCDEVATARLARNVLKGHVVVRGSRHIRLFIQSQKFSYLWMTWLLRSPGKSSSVSPLTDPPEGK